jgi:hypothetical protein
MSKATNHSPTFDPKREIAIIWAVEDVQEIRPDLSDTEAFAVLTAVERDHDCNHGICWDTLSSAAGELYPEPEADETADAEGGAL